MKNVFLLPEIAEKYDAYYQTDPGKTIDNLEKDVLKKLMTEVPRGHMLEPGCGTGHWTAFFEELGFSVTALDNSEAMLAYTSGKNIDAKFLKGDAQNLPFEDESFTVIASVTMLEFVDDQDKAINEMHRVLEPGGWLILGCLNATSVLGQNKEKDPVFKNAHFLTKEMLRKKLGNFSIIKIKENVHLSTNFEILDGKPAAKDHEPAFLAVLAQKP